MSQINVNSPTPVDEGERATSAGAGMLAVVLAIVVAVVVIWLLFSGLFSGPSSSSTNVNAPTAANAGRVVTSSPSSPGVNRFQTNRAGFSDARAAGRTPFRQPARRYGATGRASGAPGSEGQRRMPRRPISDW